MLAVHARGLSLSLELPLSVLVALFLLSGWASGLLYCCTVSLFDCYDIRLPYFTHYLIETVGCIALTLCSPFKSQAPVNNRSHHLPAEARPGNSCPLRLQLSLKIEPLTSTLAAQGNA